MNRTEEQLIPGFKTRQATSIIGNRTRHASIYSGFRLGRTYMSNLHLSSPSESW